MNTDRLKAFSDGVIAIIITIMVLGLKTPQGSDISALAPLLPALMGYVLSFIYVGIYWNNHHHLLSAAEQVSGTVLWTNLHLLFWLSLLPFATSWMGENYFAAIPTALYGCILLMNAIAYYFLTLALIKHHGQNSPLAAAIGKDFKGKISVALYITAIILAFVNAWIAIVIYAGVAVIWFIPDRRIENHS